LDFIANHKEEIVADNPNTPSAPKTPEKQAVEKQVVEKLPIKEQLKEQIKDFKEGKEVKDKPEKFEVKEKPEKFEVKEKPEKFEHKEKPEKGEFKEKDFKEKEGKFEQLEKAFELPTNPGGPVEQPGTNPGQTSSHFIAPDQRPDVSRGALAGETKK
jgi:hypothetical protein